MDLNRDDISSFDQKVLWERATVKNRTVVKRIKCECRVGNRSGRQIQSPQFPSIYVQHRSIVDLDAQDELLIPRQMSDHKRAPKICSNEMIVGGASIDYGPFITIPVAEFGRSTGPRAVIEGARNPVHALVRAIIEVFPDRSPRDEYVINADIHCWRPINCACVRKPNRC